MLSKRLPHSHRLSRREAAHFIGKSKSTLDNWARTKKNLNYRIVGNRAYYEIADLNEYLKHQQTF